MATIYELTSLPKLIEREVVLDANVWVYRYWPKPVPYDWEIGYASAYDQLLAQGTVIVADFGLISEVFYRALRQAQSDLAPGTNLKVFRKSRAGRAALADIYDLIDNTILPNVRIVENSFDKAAIHAMLVVDELDLMDKSALAICRNHRCVLMTNDSDFRYTDVDILTSNLRILSTKR
jgi:predicted nucleic acid-binding protein